MSGIEADGLKREIVGPSDVSQVAAVLEDHCCMMVVVGGACTSTVPMM
jgi:hypothetical protein